MDRAELERLDRESLVQRAQAAGVKRARVLTRPELIDELLRMGPASSEPSQLKRTRGFFGIARDLLSRVVERGLHLPDAAERFRQVLADPIPQVPRPEAQAIPTVTLAEIYAAQGHKQRAVDTLVRVLEEEPDHIAARALLEKLQGSDYVPPREPMPPEPEEIVAADEEEDEEIAIDTPRLLPEVDADLHSALEAALDAPSSHEAEELSLPTSSIEPPTIALPAALAQSLVEDRCVAVGPYVWWQLSARSQRLAEESFFFLRVVTVVPGWSGPVVTTKDFASDPSVGELVLRDLPANAVVRVAIGFMPDGVFVPVAHSPALELGPDDVVRHWSFDGLEPPMLEDPLVQSAVRRAAERIASI